MIRHPGLFSLGDGEGYGDIAGHVQEPLFTWENWRLGVVHLPGHSPGQVGYDLGQGFLAIGDALIVETFRQKYPIPFLTDLAKTRSSLDLLEARRIALAVPGHGAPLDLTTVNAFLADLARRGLVAYEVSGNRLLWQAATS